MNQSYEFPRVSTRGYYDLHTGKKLKNNNYFLYPKKKFNKIFNKDTEVVIFVHGMRNSPKGAVMGGRTLRRKLRKLGYKKHPVISFSYDANIRRAHLLDKEHKVSLYRHLLGVADKIAKANGKHLAKFIKDLRIANPNIKIHLVGHSLGCNVLEHTRANVESIHLLGSPVEWDNVISMGIQDRAKHITNYYNPKDDVIREGVTKGIADQPSCLHRVSGYTIKSKRIRAVHHGFSAYAKGLRKFP